MKILYVDDDRVNTKINSLKFEKRGHTVDVHHTGADCIKYIQSLENINGIDIVLLDIMMPDMTGTQVLEHLRRDYTESELPIIMVTSKSGDKDIISALLKGANDYICKPLNVDLALARIEFQLKLKKLASEQLDLKELETFQAMVVTYNHEINNPLTIAVCVLSKMKISGNLEGIEKVEAALLRITDIVKEITNAAETGDLTQEGYTDRSKMYSVKKTG